MQRVPEMQAFVDGLSKSTFGISITEAQSKLICVDCGTNAINTFRDSINAKEYRISGLCQDCQDRYFRALPDEDFMDDPDNVFVIDDDGQIVVE